MKHHAMTTRICLLTLVPAAVLFAAEQPWTAPARAAAKKNPVSNSPAAIAAGKAVYEKECLSCHGPTGKGDGPKAKDLKVQPHDLSAPQISGQSDGALYWKLNTGRNPMPKYDELLTEEQRWQVINYLRTVLARPAEGRAP
jgi:mono/diheme cytochrome c family protein